MLYLRHTSGGQCWQSRRLPKQLGVSAAGKTTRARRQKLEWRRIAPGRAVDRAPAEVIAEGQAWLEGAAEHLLDLMGCELGPNDFVRK